MIFALYAIIFVYGTPELLQSWWSIRNLLKPIRKLLEVFLRFWRDIRRIRSWWVGCKL